MLTPERFDDWLRRWRTPQKPWRDMSDDEQGREYIKLIAVMMLWPWAMVAAIFVILAAAALILYGLSCPFPFIYPIFFKGGTPPC